MVASFSTSRRRRTHHPPLALSKHLIASPPPVDPLLDHSGRPFSSKSRDDPLQFFRLSRRRRQQSSPSSSPPASPFHGHDDDDSEPNCCAFPARSALFVFPPPGCELPPPAPALDDDDEHAPSARSAGPPAPFVLVARPCVQRQRARSIYGHRRAPPPAPSRSLSFVIFFDLAPLSRALPTRAREQQLPPPRRFRDPDPHDAPLARAAVPRVCLAHLCDDRGLDVPRYADAEFRAAARSDRCVASACVRACVRWARICVPAAELRTPVIGCVAVYAVHLRAPK